MNGESSACAESGRPGESDGPMAGARDGARQLTARVEYFDARRRAAGTKADPSPVDAAVRRWREAAAMLDAVCRVVNETETVATLSLQDAADDAASEALGGLAAISGTDPRLLEAHADALEWLIEQFGALSEGKHYAALGRAIVADLRLLSGNGSGQGRAVRRVDAREDPSATAAED